MPKILENIREELLLETERQLKENGYAATTIRSVSSACGVGVGTVYNYFPSKDMLIASFMLRDWRKALESMQTNFADGKEKALRRVHEVLSAFIDKHRTLFEDTDAMKSFGTSYFKWHKVLRQQISEVIFPLCDGLKNQEFLSDFVAEALLTWTVEGKEFEDIFCVLRAVIKE